MVGQKRTTLGNVKKQELLAILAAPPYPPLNVAAQQAHVSPQSVYTLNSSDTEWSAAWQAARLERQAQTRQQIEGELEAAVPDAIRAVVSALNAWDDATKLRAGWRLLEQLIGKPQDKLDVTTAGQPLRVYEIAFDE